MILDMLLISMWSLGSAVQTHHSIQGSVSHTETNEWLHDACHNVTKFEGELAEGANRQSRGKNWLLQITNMLLYGKVHKNWEAIE